MKIVQHVCAALKFNNWAPELRAYESQKLDLHSLGSLLFKADKIVLPKSLRKWALEAAHCGHVGEMAMKRVMREFFWWPGMAKETETFVKNCETCTMLARRNPPIPLSSRELPDGPWEILQIDFLSASGFGSGEFLVLVDTYSRFLFVIEMHRTTAESTNTALCEIFKLWGCPKILQSDNGPPFQSAIFRKFWEDKGVKVRKSIPSSPQSNGMVERQNQSITKALAAARIDGVNWRTALQRFVHNHNTLVPHYRLKDTPFELMVGWKYRGTFPSLWSETSEKLLDRIDVREIDAEATLVSKKYADTTRGAKTSDIRVGDEVLIAQQCKSKTDPTFSAERYTVITRQGGKVVVRSDNGVQYARNVQDVRKAPIRYEEEPDEDEMSDFNNNQQLRMESEFRNGMVALPENGEGESEANNFPGPATDDFQNSTGRKLRSRFGLKKPARFFVYRIYQ
ncbi:uncharacterized protein K02A2.6-like [Wyeomyia smithii]|uniref:uncharacterized protein K02A2.6-like n=1 Tax=Wyeomyia smithii TaxID=174621 RepID=UPI002467D97B|nr:uncharacterized protein K02A2.6-like [Wyeomyia smithii]